jgi:DNA-binding protein YbaB
VAASSRWWPTARATTLAPISRLKGDLVSLQIEPTIVNATDKKMLEDLVVAAVNLALERARQLAQDEIVRATGGLPIPPGLFGT